MKRRFILVCDNLHIHNAYLYETFDLAETRRIWERLELPHTPKHVSKQDLAKIEISAYPKGYLNRRISTIKELQREYTALYIDRDKRQKGVDRQIFVGKIRSRLKHLSYSI